MYSRCALFDLPKLCVVVEDVETILKGVNHFSIQRVVFLYTVCTEKLGQMTDARFFCNNSVTYEANHVKLKNT